MPRAHRRLSGESDADRQHKEVEMRYTEYHDGVAVIKDKALLPQAMEKLAKIEDMDDIPQICCDEY